MKIFDVSLPIKNGMVVWPGDEGVNIDVKTTVEKQGVGFSRYSFGSHTGTHVDAPNHFVEGVGVDRIPLNKMAGECRVLDLTDIQGKEIKISDLPDDISEGERILFKTPNQRFLENREFTKDYVSLSEEAAEFLTKKKIFLVGTDFLGIEKKGNPGHPVHTTLLSAGVVILEGLDLSKVKAGKYQLFCLPLKIVDGDGGPARVILTRD